MIDIREFSSRSLEVAKKKGWTKDWSKGGCYIHLEVSEFIESLRGKKGNPTDELGDVLFTVLSVAKNYDVDPVDAMERVMKRMEFILEDDNE